MEEIEELEKRRAELEQMWEKLNNEQKYIVRERTPEFRKFRTKLLIELGAEWLKQHKLKITPDTKANEFLRKSKALMKIAYDSIVACPHCGNKVLFFEEDKKWHCVKCRAIFDNRQGRPLFTDFDGER